MVFSIKSRLRGIVNRLLGPLGMHLVRHDRAFEMDGLLARAAARETKIATWIDVGASNGSWSLLARRHFPTARFLLFEPLAERQDALARLHQTYGFDCVAAAAGAAPATIEFAVDPELDGSGVALDNTVERRRVPVETVDRAIAARRLAGPYGLKLDTHGYEIPVLAGASSALAQTNLIIIESYNFALTPDCLRFHELCARMEGAGFRCCDLADPMRRPTDGALWQMDLAFAPATSWMFKSNSYV